MRFSKLLVKTYKEVPKEAETISHQLMLRTSMIRQLSRGVYSYLPLGLKVLKKIENIVREEMDKAGANEILMPVIQPADIWKETGRWFAYGPELMRLQDRNRRDFVLGPTHEEVAVDIFRNMVTSYKELPLNIYQIQTKFRDEMRPRFGLMRGREFVMKDAYSFHLTEQSLDDEYNNMKQAYYNIFNRCGLNFRAVEADTGSIGGAESHEFMVLAESGEDDILYSTQSSYAANVEKANSRIKVIEYNSEKKEKELVDTLDTTTIEEVANLLNVAKENTLKVVLFTEILETSKRYYMAVIRGDLDINPIKVKNIANADMELELMSDETIKDLGLVKGYIGSLKELDILKEKNIVVVLDESVKNMRNFVTGANQLNKHYINVNIEDIHYDILGDIHEAKAGDLSPVDDGILEIARGIEVGHIFKLGTKYTKPMNVKVLNEEGKQETVIMGCYGIGVSRIAAATIEQNFDENGIIWPKPLAPFMVDIVIVNMKDEKQVSIAEEIYDSLIKNNIEAILDDRNDRAGSKFKDADLIGIPLRIVVGKGIQNNEVEVKERKSTDIEIINIDNVLDYVKNFINK